MTAPEMRDADTVRSFTDERVLDEFGNAMVAQSRGYYALTDRMAAPREWR